MSDPAQGGQAEAPGATLLVVDDNEANRVMLSRRLRRRGFDVDDAADAASALAAAKRKRYDLILMDMSLPGMDGWAATRVLRSDAATADVLVVALTANVLPQHREQAFEAGCDAFETKPVQFDRLLATMDRLLQAKRATPPVDACTE